MGNNYLVYGAKLKCTQGTEENKPATPMGRSVTLNKDEKVYVTKSDYKYPNHIPKFGYCKKQCEDCTPDPVDGWLSCVSDFNISFIPLATEASGLVCSNGGVILPQDSGQDELDALFDLILEVMKKYGLFFEPYTSDPVSVMTGNFVTQKMDIEICGFNGLQFYRTYNSTDNRIGVLGQGWTHNHSCNIDISEDALVITLQDGRIETYKKGNDGLYNTYDVSGVSLRQSNAGYLRLDRNGGCYCFDKAGVCTCIRDSHGNETKYTYESGHIVIIQNIGGTLYLKYAGDLLSNVQDHTGREVQYLYDNNNNLIAVRNAEGSIYRYEYDRSGHLNKEIAPNGGCILANTYDKNGRTLMQKFPDGGEVTFEYDENNKRTIFIDQAGNKTKYYRDNEYHNIKTTSRLGLEEKAFNEYGQITWQRSINGSETYFSYNSSGKPDKIISSIGHETKISYDSLNQPIKLVRPNGGLIQYIYDNEGNIIKIIDPVGATYQLTYTSYGLISAIKNPIGGAHTFTYDDRFNPISCGNPLGDQIQVEYDSLNRPIRIVDSMGNSTKLSYNNSNKVTEIVNQEEAVRKYEYNERGKVSRVVDYDGLVVTCCYNTFGLLESVFNDDLGELSFQYDKRQNVTRVKQFDNTETALKYNKLNRLVQVENTYGGVTHFRHDSAGNAIAATLPSGLTLRYAYDKLNRLVKADLMSGRTVNISYDAHDNISAFYIDDLCVMQNKFDAADHLIERFDDYGNRISYTYNELGKISSEHYNDYKVKYSYDISGRLTDIECGDGIKSNIQYNKNGKIKRIRLAGETWTFDYTSTNLVSKITGPDGHSESMEYSSVGQLIKHLDREGNIHKFEYSPARKIIKKINPDDSAIAFSYDENGDISKIVVAEGSEHEAILVDVQYCKGKIKSVSRPDGTAEKYYYDTMGNLIQHITADNQKTNFSYNNNGTLSGLSYPDGRVAKFSSGQQNETIISDWLGETHIQENSLGFPVSVTDQDGDKVQYEWNAMGKCSKLIYPDGTIVEYCYDSSGRMTGVTTPEVNAWYTYYETGQLASRRLSCGVETKYEYDALGRTTTILHLQNGQLLDRFDYTYTPAGSISRMRRVHSNNGLIDTETVDYAYDPVGRLIMKRNGDSYTCYSYDNRGNRVQSSQNGIRTEYTYNERNQLVSKKVKNNSWTYIYDIRGNLQSIQQNGRTESRFIFDTAGMLACIDIPAQGRVEYIYNAKKQLIRRITTSIDGNKTSEKYVLDITKPFDNLLMIRNDKDMRFYWGNGDSDLLYGCEEQMEYSYLLDRLGSPVRLVNGKNLNEAIFYDEFGVCLSRNHTGNPFGFTRYRMEPVGGLYYAQMRFYDPENARMLSEDWKKDRYNWYSYADNNPLRFVDRSGCALTAAEQNFEESNPYVYEALVELDGFVSNMYELDQRTRGDGNYRDYFDFCAVAQDIREMRQLVNEIGNKRTVGKYIADGSVNPVERVLASEYPIRMAMHLWMGYLARDTTASIYGEGALGAFATNGNQDAFRHALWSYDSASRIGSYYTWLFTSAHEYGYASNLNPNDPGEYLGTIMDLYNNNQGIQANNTNTNSGRTSAESIFELIELGDTIQIGSHENANNNTFVPTEYDEEQLQGVLADLYRR